MVKMNLGLQVFLLSTILFSLGSGDEFHLKNEGTYVCMEVRKTDSKLIGDECDEGEPSTTQLWTTKAAGDGVNLVNVKSGDCVEVNDKNRDVAMAKCEDGAQKQIFQYKDHVFHFKEATGKQEQLCLFGEYNSRTDRVVAKLCQNVKFEKWMERKESK